MNRLITILAVATAALATLCAVQWQKLSRQQTRITALGDEVAQKQSHIEELEGAQQQAEQQKRELLQMTDELSGQLRAQQFAQQAAQATNPPPPTPASDPEPAKPGDSGFGGMLSKLMSDPDTKKFIREQQRMMIDQLYRPLIKQLGLNAEEAAAFKELLAENTMRSADKATSLLGNLSATNRAELVSSMTAEQQNSEEQIKAFLGEERFAIYKAYQETSGERAQLNLFRQQNDAGEYPLNDVQVEQLLAFMKDEKRNASAAMGLATPGQDQAAMEAMLSGEGGDKLIQAQELANQRVFDRARSVLSPDQLRAFGTFQTNQLQMVRMGLSMARKLMAPPGPPVATPGQ